MPGNLGVESPPSLAPIVVDVLVACPADRAFDYFAHDIGRWWPLPTHSLGREQSASVRFEPREGGRLIERVRDGTEHVWGRVTHWTPGQRLAFTWHLDRAPSTAQLVDVTFVAQGAQTRVTLTHSGWERREDGAKARENYTSGWKLVFEERYSAFCADSAAGVSGG